MVAFPAFFRVMSLQYYTRTPPGSDATAANVTEVKEGIEICCLHDGNAITGWTVPSEGNKVLQSVLATKGTRWRRKWMQDEFNVSPSEHVIKRLKD